MNNAGEIPLLYISCMIVAAILALALSVFGLIPISFMSLEWLVASFATLILFVVWHCVHDRGWKRCLTGLPILFVLPFVAEVYGVNSGHLFGHYRYTDALGTRLFGVPLIIGVAWVLILYASAHLASLLVSPAPYIEQDDSRWRKFASHAGLAGVGAFAATAWDLMMDPVAVGAGWWRWHGGGAYTPHVEGGVPISNFLGWWIVAFLCLFLYQSLQTASIQNGRRNLYLGAIILYLYLFLAGLAMSLLALKRSDVALIGAMSMGPFIVAALCWMGTMGENGPPNRKQP